MRKTVRLLSLMLIIALVLGICTNVSATSASTESSSDSQPASSEPAEDDETIAITEESVTIKVDETKKLTATASKGTKINWESNSEETVTVGTDGTIKGIKVGTATITATLDGKNKSDTCTVKVEAKEGTGAGDGLTWSDFSKADISLTANGTVANLKIANIKLNSSNSYYGVITSNKTEPAFIKNPTSSSETISLTKDSNGFSANVTKYVELNQDLYLWVAETQTDSQLQEHQKWIINGTKLTRYSEPQYTAVFESTNIAYDGYQIATNFTNSGTADRKMTIKIGKITDTSILKKIKNKDNSGFGDLLKFAKTDNGFYNNTTHTAKSGSHLMVEGRKSNGDPIIDISKNIAGGQNYYLYVKMDDENGKYITQEGITLASANIRSNGEWSLMFYGSGDFQWANFDEAGSGTTNNKPADGTQMQGKLPQTGQGILIPIGVVAAIGVGIFFAKKYKKFDF